MIMIPRATDRMAITMMAVCDRLELELLVEVSELAELGGVWVEETDVDPVPVPVDPEVDVCCVPLDVVVVPPLPPPVTPAPFAVAVT
jgi:hypothetical protein